MANYNIEDPVAPMTNGRYHPLPRYLLLQTEYTGQSAAQEYGEVLINS